MLSRVTQLSMNLLAYLRPVFNISVTFPKEKKNPKNWRWASRWRWGRCASICGYVSEWTKNARGKKKDSSSRTRQDSESIKSDHFHLVSQHIFHLLLVFICFFFFFFFCSVVTLWRRVVYTFSLFPSFSSWHHARRETKQQQQQKKREKTDIICCKALLSYTHTLW